MDFGNLQSAICNLQSKIPYAQVLEEQWTNGALSATTGYVYGDDLISRTVTHPHPSQEGTFYYHYDGMGSTRTLTDTTGAVTDTYQYDAYGNLFDKTGSTINPYLYRGEQFDDDLSAYYLRARYYQPGIGRFLTTDPVEGFPNNPMTLHRYVYGNDDPVNFIDPSGTRSMSMLEMVGVAVIVNGLSTIALQHNIGGIRSVYEMLGEKVFPDAAIFGALYYIAEFSRLFRLPKGAIAAPNVGIGGIPVGVEIL